MPSNKSPSPVATSTKSPRASTSPALTQSPYATDMYRSRRRMATTVETTPPPPTTTTPSPPPDPYEYEKSSYGTFPITDSELELLKEQVRLLNGLPLTKEKRVLRIEELRPPSWRPRATLTSWRRAQLQQRRMVIRCGGNLKHKLDEYGCTVSDSEDSPVVYRQLRNEAMSQTSDQIELRAEQQELQELKYLAQQAKRHEVAEYRDNQVSRLRFKSVRGEPIISSNFREAYEYHLRPPFVMARRVPQSKVYQLPKINKRKEIWLMPMDEQDVRPLISQTRTPKPKGKRAKKGARPTTKRSGQEDSSKAEQDSPKDNTKDRRSSKERAQPATKKDKGSPKSGSKDKKKGGRRKRPPWHYGPPCPVNSSLFR